MAYYNANRVIKLTRKALGLTQEKLSEGVCEVETYSKIENGHRTLRRSTYQKLMEKMGRNTDRRYAVCVSKDGMLLDEKIELERAFKRYDYESAEKYLNILKEKVDDNLLTRQYMARVEALVEYYRKRISAEELIKKLDEALKITVPEYEKFLDEEVVYPFTKMEMLTLMSLGNACQVCGRRDYGHKVYKVVQKCLGERYIGEPDNMTLSIAVGKNMARAYAEQMHNQEALLEINKCIELVITKDYGCKAGVLLVAKAYNYIVSEHDEGVGKEQIENASKCLRQAFYLAAARGDDKSANEIKEYYIKHFVNPNK